MLKRLLRTIKATMGIYEPTEGHTYGVLAEYADPGALLHAAEQVHEAGYNHFDTYSPFPVHGMSRAMGLGNSKAGYFTLGGGITGLLIGYLLQWWTGGVDYPLNISGKPFFAVEPSVPIIFELTILFAAFGAALGMLVLNGLPRPYNPLFFSKAFSRASDDGFFLFIAASDTQFDLEKTRDLLGGAGATGMEVIRDLDEAETGEAETGEAETGEAETGEAETGEAETGEKGGSGIKDRG